MSPGDPSRASAAVVRPADAPALERAHGMHIAGGTSLERTLSMRAEAVAVSREWPAAIAFEAVLNDHARCAAQNLRCVLSTGDPEGPHQLRVSLRRLRVALRVFKPAVKRESGKRIAWMARYIGAIAGELRDADVLINDVLGSSLAKRPALKSALSSWREGVRARVRASLQAARATSYANDLIQLSASGAWRKGKRNAGPAAGVCIEAALDGLYDDAAARGERLLALAAEERHDLRKDVKALRYTTEHLAMSGADIGERVAALKRLQTALGELNDAHMLVAFDPDVGAAQAELADLRRALNAEHARRTPKLVLAANQRWRDLSSTEAVQLSAIA